MEHRHGFIVFVPDFPNQFFQYVLNRNDAGNASVTVNDRSHLQFIVLEIFQQQGNFRGAMDIRYIF